MPHIEQTLAIIKPDAFEHRVVGNIITMIEQHGLRIAAMTMMKLTAGQARHFYAVHEGKPFYEPLIEFMSSGPCMPMLLEGEGALLRWRTLMGPTDPAQAPENTIRRRYGTTVRFNAVHGSDSIENALMETAFFFAERGIAAGDASSRKESNA